MLARAKPKDGLSAGTCLGGKGSNVGFTWSARETDIKRMSIP